MNTAMQLCTMGGTSWSKVRNHITGSHRLLQLVLDLQNLAKAWKVTKDYFGGWGQCPGRHPGGGLVPSAKTGVAKAEIRVSTRMTQRLVFFI